MSKETDLTLDPKETLTVSRRSLLKAGLYAGAGMVLAKGLSPGKALAQQQPVCTQSASVWNLTPYLDPLPILPTLRPGPKSFHSVFYDLSITQSTHQFHAQLPANTPVWGYNGGFLGPTIETTTQQNVQMRFTNKLQSYLICPDLQVDGTTPIPYAVVHNHGLVDRQDSDGFPLDRFPPGESYTYEYPNLQRASQYWYHDHSMGVTRIALYSGLAGNYIVRDPNEARFRLPCGPYEIPLVIQDKQFDADGRLYLSYPWSPEAMGNYVTVNGKVWPYLNVARGKYRFRILNASNARFYNLQLSPAPPAGTVFQIGTDGGFLPQPVDLTVPQNTPMGGLLLAVAERADVIIDFSKYAPGTKVTLTNNAPAPFPGGAAPDSTQVGPGIVMQFIVTNQRGWNAPLPASFGALQQNSAPVRELYHTLVDYGSPLLSSNFPAQPPMGRVPYPTLLLNNRRFMEPPTETPKAGSTETWHLINLAPDSHPIHVHQTQFRIISRQAFDPEAFCDMYGVNGPYINPTESQLQIPYTDVARAPYPFEDGMKDTVRANPNEVTTIEIPFGMFRGSFVWHCHMVDHEDNEMMRPLLITG